jgi:hypothetical protein
MHAWLKLSHHRHSGKLRPHEYTSYLPLLFLLVITGVLLGMFTAYAAPPGPDAESVSLSGTMPGKAPTTAAKITSPSQNQRFASTPITVRGTCPEDTLVEVYKNDIFAGSTPCSDSGTFEIKIDLLIGKNVLVARVYDALNQAGPDSNKVTVFYDALPPQGAGIQSLSFGGAQLLLNTDAVYRGVFPDKEMLMPIDILGGTPPFALNIQWGDGSNKVVPRPDNQNFSVSHIYKKPGVYQITLQASDSQGRVAFLTVAAIVNGQPGVVATTDKTTPSNKILMLWPLYTASVAVVISFWLGERREKRLLLRHGPVYAH